MNPPSALQTFVDEELLRAPLVLQSALQGTIDALQKGPAFLGASERSIASDVILRASSHRTRIVDRYVSALREHIQAELSHEAMIVQGAGPRTTGSLALVDDEEVSVDVVISHTIEAIKSVAEHELRELLAYTSAMVGDMDVGADHNPLRAETQAQALWAAAQALPLSRGHQLTFMRHAAMPMAQALRKAYAAACARLDGEGLEPAAYRTLIPPSGARTSRRLDPNLMESMPTIGTITLPIHLPVSSPVGQPASQPVSQHVSPPAGAAPPQAANPAIPPQPAAPIPSGFEQKVLALTGRLFESMIGDRRLAPGVPALLARLQPFAVKAALDDPSLLEQPQQPLWRFIDLAAHMALLESGPDGQARERLLRFAGKLCDQLAEEPRHTPQLYGWATERLERYAAKRLAERCALAEAHVATMQQLEDKLSHSEAPISTFHGAIDVNQLDTVPADLMDQPHLHRPGSADNALRWLSELRAGTWLRIFRKGGWVRSQLLWPGERGEVWLFADGDSDDSWAIRRSAITLLREEGLAQVMLPRSLLNDASERLLRRATSA
jgi:Protein of unknown function (DUF1631)